MNTLNIRLLARAEQPFVLFPLKRMNYLCLLRCIVQAIVIEYRMINWYNEAVECVYTHRTSG